MESWESPVERAIREAQERGEFDDLPGAGKPLRNLGSAQVDDPVEPLLPLVAERLSCRSR